MDIDTGDPKFSFQPVKSDDCAESLSDNTILAL